MKRVLLALFVALAAPVVAAEVGVSVSVGQPGFYGRIDIGGYPAPQVIYAEPVIVHRAPHAYYEPVYVRVPHHHARDWRRYCGQYGYCGRPVYFVNDGWYRDVYSPRHRPPPPPHVYYREAPPRHDYYREHGYPPRHEHGHGHRHGRD